MNNIAYGYCRASTDDQTISIEVQQEKIKQYCALNNLDLKDIIIDLGVSGKTLLFKRKGGKQLLNNDFQHIVVMKLDRLSRSTSDFLNTKEYFSKNKIALHILDLGLNTDTPMGEAMCTFVAAFATLERRLIGQRTRDALQSMKRQGKRVGGIPVGHTVNKVQCGTDERGLPKYEKFIVPDPDFDVTKKIIMDNKDKPLRYIKTLLPHSMALGTINSLRATL